MLKPKYLINRHYYFILFLILTVSFFYFGTYRNWPYKIEGDGKYYYQYLVSGIYDHDFDFTNNYSTDKYPWMVMDIDHYNLRYELNERTNRPGNVWSVGLSILWLPFFTFALIIGKTINLFNFHIDTSPFGLYMQYATMFSAVIYALLSSFLLCKLIQKHFSESSSKLSLWMIIFMTPLYYYTIFEPSMSHVYDFFTFTLVIYFYLEFLPNKKKLSYIIFALVCALHVLTRTQNIASIFIIYLVIIYSSLKNEGIKNIFQINYILLIITFIIGILPIPLINNYLYGSPFKVPQGEEFMGWSDPQIIQLLFSYRNGFFSHHPIYFIGIIGYICFLFSKKYEKKLFYFCLLFIFITQVYINSTVADWWSGHSFGQRRLLSSLPIFAIGISFLLDKIKYNYLNLYNNYLPLIVTTGTILWFYLTMIHVFIWDYNKPHNIYKWMFYYAPNILNDYYQIL